MADEKETKFKLSVETREFVEKILEAKANVTSLASEGSLSNFAEGLLKVGAAAGVLGAAFLAIKTSLEAVFDAEHINQINNQFSLLTTNAGIATGTLKKGLEEAAGGLIDDADLMQSANKALVEMGDRARRLPEILALARQATVVFGGDAKSNFEAINQAIATGNTRMLRNLGLKIDQQKAEENYAKSIGATVAEKGVGTGTSEVENPGKTTD